MDRTIGVLPRPCAAPPQSGDVRRGFPAVFGARLQSAHLVLRRWPAVFYPLARSLLFKLDPERAHHLALSGLDRLHRSGLSRLAGCAVSAPREVMGLRFDNPVGLAAGLDKNGEHIDALAALGFGFIEVGTVTPRPQPGNPKPRMFRLPEHEAIINRLGFNNGGLAAFVANVQRAQFRGVLGLNIGKNADTPIDKAVDDYVTCLTGVYPHASYVTVNVSSPNTQGLRDLQAAKQLDQLLGTLKAEQARLAKKHAKQVPLALKIAPDLDLKSIREIAKLALEHRFDALIATNTTVSRDAVMGHPLAKEAGGLSGRPLFSPSTEVLRELARALKGNLPLIGVGGILSGADAKAKIDAGAALVQLYSGFIYRGPDLIAEAVRAIGSAGATR
ncbi:MAG: quinone-dependent dihydroorotate dehydrogenase [Betaproteobacteria bacterium]|nr:quinone-dependent dihydroorotate dehydrogenase [Betaproteobacteria bacterium]